MYCVFAQATGIFGRYHIPLSDSIYNHGKSVWFESQFNNLDFKYLLSNAQYRSGHFVVMQSNTKITASAVREKMGKLFD